MNAVVAKCLGNLIALDKLDWVPELGDPDDSILAIRFVDDRLEKIRKLKRALMNDHTSLRLQMPLPSSLFRYLFDISPENIYEDMCGPAYTSGSGYLARDLSEVLDDCVKVVQETYGT
jgi:hypothetical protein